MEITRWGLTGHFRRNKIIEAVEHRFYWPSLKKDVRLVSQCRTCQLVKQRKQNTGLYTPLSVSNCSWQDIRMNFVLGVPKTARKHDSILVVDRFSKMAHFLSYSKTSDASRIATIYFDEIVRLHGLAKTIVSERDVKFTSYF